MGRTSFGHGFTSGQNGQDHTSRRRGATFHTASGATVGKLITALGSKLNLQVEFAEQEIQQANLSLDQEIRLDVKQVTREELLSKVLEPAGLTYELNDNVLKVKPAKK